MLDGKKAIAIAKKKIKACMTGHDIGDKDAKAVSRH